MLLPLECNAGEAGCQCSDGSCSCITGSGSGGICGIYQMEFKCIKQILRVIMAPHSLPERFNNESFSQNSEIHADFDETMKKFLHHILDRNIK